MTVKEAAEIILGKDATWDGALPQDWVNEFKRKTGVYMPGQCVWYYPKEGEGRTFGRPVPLTDEAREALGRYK